MDRSKGDMIRGGVCVCVCAMSHLRGAEPDVPHVVTDGLGGRHGAGQLPGLDHGSTTQLHRLGEGERGRERQRKGWREKE